jgi:drug/metabolite transporter (DMT)-like permease
MAFREPGGNVRAMNLLLLALVPACFAMNPVIGRAMAGIFGPASLSVTRWVLSGLIIALVAVARGRAERWRAPVGLYGRLVVLGALGMGFCAYAAFAAARTTTATNISLIYACTTALVAAWEMGSGRQRATLTLLTGIVACLAGVATILTRGHPEVLLALTFTPGDLWAAAGTLVFAGYTVAMRRVPAGLTPLAQFSIMSVGATLALLPAAVSEVAAAGVPAITAATLPWLAALVLVAGIGAFLGYNLSLIRNGPVLTSASISLNPIYAAGLAIVLIGEQLAWYHAIALATVVGGLLLINRSQGRRV